MDQKKHSENSDRKGRVWLTLEDLIAPDPHLRDSALEELGVWEGFEEQPLVIYLVATRLLDPDLEIRFHAARLLGDRVVFNSASDNLPEKSLSFLAGFMNQLDRSQLVKLLEVAAAYLAAEDAIGSLLRLCSYAGNGLGGIVNDRMLPVEIRQQALFYCGEVGYLNTAPAIKNLVQRIQKNKARPKLAPTRKKQLDEEHLLPFAVAALSKLEGS